MQNCIVGDDPVNLGVLSAIRPTQMRCHSHFGPDGALGIIELVHEIINQLFQVVDGQTARLGQRCRVDMGSKTVPDRSLQLPKKPSVMLLLFCHGIGCEYGSRIFTSIVLRTILYLWPECRQRTVRTKRLR